MTIDPTWWYREKQSIVIYPWRLSGNVLSTGNPATAFSLPDLVDHKFMIHARRGSQPQGCPWRCCINKSGAGVGVVVCGRVYDFYLISGLEKNGLFLLIAQIRDLRTIKMHEFPTR